MKTLQVLTISIGIAIVGTIFVFMILPLELRKITDQKITNISESYPIIKEAWGNKIRIENSTQASLLTGFDIKFPSKVPAGYNLELAAMDPTITGNKYVWLFYSQIPITDTMRLDEFFAQKGFWINYQKTQQDLHNDTAFNTWLSNYLSATKNSGYDSQEITINGNRGIAFDQHDRDFEGHTIHDPSQVEFIAGDSDITLQGYLPKEELIQIAESIS